MHKAWLAICGLAVLGACTHGPDVTGQEAMPVLIDKDRIDTALKGLVATGQVAGNEALIFEDGREVYYNKFGMADIEAKRPMARNTIIRIFSMTKPVTGVALMQQYELGKFQFDDPVSKYLPEFANARVFDGL